ncbi:cell wall protein [Streptomyces griseorubiginosus]|uniref:cell wall protein n=1 Tax=Streptomyces griseorubiginosus TaxID=67304 RepID=UPI003326721C
MSTRRDVDTSTFQPVTGTAQEVTHTASRRSGPRKWLTAVRWLIAAGLHPKANHTTQRVAEDLAARMDYTTGHARYCLLETAARLDVDKATVKRHVKYLRELGALAWVQHGSHANVRPLHDLPGYAATATVYAAVIPASYDHAMGHTIIGTGYTARIVIDQRGQTNSPVDTPSNSPVDNSGSEGLAPPSRTGVKEESQVDLVGGFNYTEQARPPKTRIPHQSTLIGGRRRTAVDVQKASNTTRLVRALVNWTQPVGLRDLEFVLRPWTDLGWDALRIADNLNGMCAGVRWKPTNPIAFIRARIAADTRQQAELAAAVAWEDSTAGREAADRASLAKLFGTTAPQQEPERTAQDREYARHYGWEQWEEVAAHYDEDPDDALDLYGTRLCSYAVGKAAHNATYAPAF